MHLLVSQPGTAIDPDEAVDLGQDPADVLFLSAADTDLASCAAARETVDGAPSLRVANLSVLSHPMSVDTWIARTASRSRCIVVRVLGGAGYWTYGLEKLIELARTNGIALAALPGDGKPDRSLEPYNTVSQADRETLSALLSAGGTANFARFLRAAQSLSDGTPITPVDPEPVDAVGFYGAVPSASERPVAAIVFYRAALLSGDCKTVDALHAELKAVNLDVIAIFVTSLRDPASQRFVRTAFAHHGVEVVVNLTGFAVSSPVEPGTGTVLDETGAVVLQAVMASVAWETWATASTGLGPRDLAMNIALPEVDGRVLARAIAFKDAASWNKDVQANVVRHEPLADRVRFTAELASNWVRLRKRKASERKVAIVLANYPNKDGRVGNGVGLDTPAATLNVLRALRAEGYEIQNVPDDSQAFMSRLLQGRTNSGATPTAVRAALSLNDYEQFFETLPSEVRLAIKERWGSPQADPFVRAGRFELPVTSFGNVVVGIQPARGYNIDPVDTYHSPDLVPPHGYLAFYGWLRREFDAHAIVHMGKHGTMEWLPGKGCALSRTCFPEAVFGPTPHLYPFIVNDPGEGTQAKRRAQAVIVDHLTPPLTRAETYGSLRDLENLVDEYFEAAATDPRRMKTLRQAILELARTSGLADDLHIRGREDDDALQSLDTYLCELKEMQIRDGLHVFGQSPAGRLRDDLVCALARLPRRLGELGDASLQRAIAHDLQLDDFDPIDCDLGAPWTGRKPALLANASADPWRTNGDTVERIEAMASLLVAKGRVPDGWVLTKAVMENVECTIAPAVEACGTREMNGLLCGLSGRFVAPGPSGAPTRGRTDVLPTGRNFFSVDTRSVPTPTAWALGRKSAELLLTRHRQDHGDWPAALALSVWGTSNMRTGGDDLAQAFALIGATPTWDHASRRVTGFEVITLAKLGRPRIDVTLRISGFFRDAFPAQIELFDRAVRTIAALDEDEEDNPLAARVRSEALSLISAGFSEAAARRTASWRVFGSKPGAYGAGLQALIDEGIWSRRADLGEAFLEWGGYAYGEGVDGTRDRVGFERRLANVDAIVHNQDNREHDLLDSDDYYQFEGGMSAAAESLTGTRPPVWHNDHSRPERPVVRTLEDEIARVVRARVVNPKWIAGVMRHGYKGAFELAATVDYMFAFAATTGAVADRHFDLVLEAYVENDAVRQFMRDANPDAARELAARLLEAQDRGLWRPRSNSARMILEAAADEQPKALETA